MNFNYSLSLKFDIWSFINTTDRPFLFVFHINQFEIKKIDNDKNINLDKQLRPFSVEIEIPRDPK